MSRVAVVSVGKLVLASIFLTAATLSPTLVHARRALPIDTAATIQVAELPRQGQETYRLVHQGGPFPHDKDGAVFGNRERQLPAQQRGYYREYTVKTPSSRDRGARRLVCGGRPTTPDACYYTGDHYASFRKVVE